MGPGAREAHVEVKVLEGNIVRGNGGTQAELGRGTVVTTGRVGRGHLGHDDMPGGVPSGADSGDDELRREGLSPEELSDGSEEVGIENGVGIEGHGEWGAAAKPFGLGFENIIGGGEGKG